MENSPGIGEGDGGRVGQIMSINLGRRVSSW